MSSRRPPFPVALRLLAALALATSTGCMSAITSASLRHALREAVDSLAEATTTDATAPAHDAEVAAALATDAETRTGDAPDAAPARLSLDEAVDRAVTRLEGAGRLDAATQATLLAILENTSPEDWPAAIDAFTASLESQRPPRPRAAPKIVPVAAVAEAGERLVFPAGSPAQVAANPAPEKHAVENQAVAIEPRPAEPPAAVPHSEPKRLEAVEAARPVLEPLAEPSAKADSTAASGPPGAAPAVVPEPLAAEEPLAPSAPAAPVDQGELARQEPGQPEARDFAEQTVEPRAPTPPSAPLSIRNPCFVSRVRAWGVVDRFPEAAFRPGQDVIVYFELDAPTARATVAGHSTSVDTLFRLVAPDGRQVGQWDFEPIDETCHAPRRDYFARYFLRIPDTAPRGPCRLEFVVTDLVAGTSTQAHLDLEVR